MTIEIGDPLLEVRDLIVTYTSRGRAPVTAVDGVSLTIGENETVGLVGESGSGKSTIGRAILGLTPVAGGSITFGGRDITHWSLKRRRTLASELQVVFQDPYSSLNPTRTVGQTLAESLVHSREKVSAQQIADRVSTTLQQVGLDAGARLQYPSHFSGGQRQRIAIARALMGRPRLVICDEPTSALDLSVQAQVLNLLNELQSSLKLSYLFVSHDLAVVRHLSKRIIVLRNGAVVEQGDADRIYQRAEHPYTQALLSAAPLPDPRRQRARREAITVAG
jgi:ABC-type oligopeptide transport system ATPase subunit